MSVNASGCNVSVTLDNAFRDGNDTLYAAGSYGGGTIAGKTLTPEFFDVIWKNYDGTILETDEAEYGKLPTYGGEMPVNPADELRSYSFIGWTPDVSPIDADTIYTATFEPVDGCFSGHSLTLDGDIGINFYVTLTDAQLTRGDANVDGTVTIFDATVIQRELADLYVPAFNDKAADITGDGLDILDATAIQRYLADFDDPYHIREYISDNQQSTETEHDYEGWNPHDPGDSGGEYEGWMPL